MQRKNVRKLILAAANQIFAAANKFADYNFRKYFTRVAKEDMRLLLKLPPDSDTVTNFLKQKKVAVDLMKRMAKVNATYAKVPVVLDKSAQKFTKGKKAPKKVKLLKEVKKRAKQLKKKKQQA